MKKIAALSAASLLALTTLTACKDPHEGEHCVSYSSHTHTSYTGTGKNRHLHTYTTRDCNHWEKDK